MDHYKPRARDAQRPLNGRRSNYLAKLRKELL